MNRVLLLIPAILPALYGSVVGQLQLGEGGMERTMMVIYSFMASLVIVVASLALTQLLKIKSKSLVILFVQIVGVMVAITWLYNSFPPVRY